MPALFRFQNSLYQPAFFLLYSLQMEKDGDSVLKHVTIGYM